MHESPSCDCCGLGQDLIRISHLTLLKYAILFLIKRSIYKSTNLDYPYIRFTRHNWQPHHQSCVKTIEDIMYSGSKVQHLLLAKDYGKTRSHFHIMKTYIPRITSSESFRISQRRGEHKWKLGRKNNEIMLTFRNSMNRTGRMCIPKLAFGGFLRSHLQAVIFYHIWYHCLDVGFYGLVCIASH